MECASPAGAFGSQEIAATSLPPSAERHALFFLRLPPRNGQIVVRLKIHPELRCGAEVSRQSQGHLRGDAALLLHDFIHVGGGTRGASASLLAFNLNGTTNSSRRISPE